MRFLLIILVLACAMPAAAEARRTRTYDKPGYLMPEHAKDTNYNTAAITKSPFENEDKSSGTVHCTFNQKPPADDGSIADIAAPAKKQ
ncbi:MAG: hypothetical protein AB7G06_08425 [Bdellovibrionales bacterium]